AGLSFAAVHEARRGIAVVCAVKLVVVPAAAALACALLGVTGLAARIVVLFAALPTATSAYILSRQMGGDAALMAQVVAATTAAAALTLPLMLAILG
ncbi:MAG: AEC family transporter, partial [Alphaproteobacteria bacterium]